jgi:hypothetical protein
MKHAKTYYPDIPLNVCTMVRNDLYNKIWYFLRQLDIPIELNIMTPIWEQIQQEEP